MFRGRGGPRRAEMAGIRVVLEEPFFHKRPVSVSCWRSRFGKNGASKGDGVAVLAGEPFRKNGAYSWCSGDAAGYGRSACSGWSSVTV